MHGDDKLTALSASLEEIYARLQDVTYQCVEIQESVNISQEQIENLVTERKATIKGY